MSVSPCKSIWITWDDHRRSRELALAFGLEYIVLSIKAHRFIRYPYLAVKTLIFLLKNKPKLVVCQNPSIVLSALLCLMKPIFGYFLVVDRHSNFKLSTRNFKAIKWKLFHVISDYSLRCADLTIVTNESAKTYVQNLGAKAVILPDKVPSLEPTEIYDLGEGFSFFFICTFSDDEPVEEVVAAFSRLSSTIKASIYITGNYSKFPKYADYADMEGINFLGYVDDTVYVNFLFSCDAAIVLTEMPMTLNCGSYEALAAGKPQIVASSTDICSYFYKGAVFLENFSNECLQHNLKEMIDSYDDLVNEQSELREEILAVWNKKFESVKMILPQY